MTASHTRHLLIADAQIEDLDVLLAGLDAGVAPWLVQPGDDAVGLILKALALPGLERLHLLAHGAPGEIRLGGRAITAADVRQRFDGAAERNLEIACWSCHTGAGEAGQAFVQALAEATGARVFAASGLVGAAGLGGSWELEGAVAAPFDEVARAGFGGVLEPTPTPTLVGQPDVDDRLPLFPNTAVVVGGIYRANQNGTFTPALASDLGTDPTVFVLKNLSDAQGDKVNQFTSPPTTEYGNDEVVLAANWFTSGTQGKVYGLTLGVGQGRSDVLRLLDVADSNALATQIVSFEVAKNKTPYHSVFTNKDFLSIKLNFSTGSSIELIDLIATDVLTGTAQGLTTLAGTDGAYGAAQNDAQTIGLLIQQIAPNLAFGAPNDDSVQPTASVTAHDEPAKTITYTFSEPVQINSEDDGKLSVVDPAKLALYAVDANGDYSEATEAPGTNITDATFDVDGKVLTLTYTGTLVEGTKYVVDAWGYDIVDLAGNEIVPDVAQMFVVSAPEANGILTLTNTTGGRDLSNARQGDVLSASVTDSDGVPNGIVYNWERSDDGNNWTTHITNDVGPTYTLTQDDVGKQVHVYVSYTDNGGTQESHSSTPTNAIIDVNDAPFFMGLSGMVTTGVLNGGGSYHGGAPSTMVLDATGHILVAGQVHSFNDLNFALTRHDAVDGRLDTTFGDGGVVMTDAGGQDTITSVALDSSNRILVAGATATSNYSQSDFALARYNTDGTLDTTFGESDGGSGRTGLVTIDFGGIETGSYSVAEQSDQTILAAGISDGWKLALARYTVNGELIDSSIIADPLTVGLYYNANLSIAELAGDKILVAGYVNGDIVLARYNTNGTLDTTFGESDGNDAHTGFVATDFGGANDQAGGILRLQDGKILVAGISDGQVVLARYTATGDLDASFNTDGLVETGVNAITNYPKVSLAEQNGKVLVGVVTDDQTLVVMRYDTNGALDTNFGESDGNGRHIGRVTTKFDYTRSDWSLAVQSDGAILAAGVIRGDFGLLRFTANGAPDASFDGGATPTFALGGATAVLDSDVQTFDIDVWSLNNDQGNYDGTSLTVERSGGANTADSFGFATNGPFAVVGNASAGVLQAKFDDNKQFATYTHANGRLTIDFAEGETNGTLPDNYLVSSVLQGISWQTTDTSVTTADLTWTFNDGHGGTATGSSKVKIAPPNHAPELNADDYSPALPPIVEDVTSANNPGTKVSDLVADGSITDEDGTAVEAIAISAWDYSNGTWQYRIGEGDWSYPGPGDGQALLLGADDYIRFVPMSNYNGKIDAAITFHAWDQSSGSADLAGNYITVSDYAGGSGLLSAQTDTASITVTPVNDAPSLLGLGGIVMTDIGAWAQDQSHSVSVLADHKVLVIGKSYNETTQNDDFVLVRYNPDGSLDTGFGDGDGKVTVDIGANDSAFGAMLADGKILVAGRSGNANNDGVFDFALTRFNANGVLDTSFGGGDGIVKTSDAGIFDNREYGDYSVAMQADGTTLVAGSIDSDFALVRYTATGDFDTNFGSGDGIVTSGFSQGSSEAARAVVQTTDGILVAGHYFGDFALARYTNAGVLDTNFGGGDGFVTTNVKVSSASSGHAIAEQTDGKIVVAGQCWTDNAQTRELALVRYTSTGELDTAFGGGDGIVTTDLGWGPLSSENYSVAMQGDKILVQVTVNNAGNMAFALARFNANGTLDTSFGGGDGKVMIDFGHMNAQDCSFAFDTNGNILVNGSTNGDFVLARYTPDGVLDPSFDGGTTPTFHQGGTPVVIDADVQVFDPELAELNEQPDGGDWGEYQDTQLTIQRSGTADNSDRFGFSAQNAGFAVDGENLTRYDQANNNQLVTFATFTNSAGVLTINFTGTTPAWLVNNVLQHITYANTSENPPESVNLTWTFSDGDGDGATITGASQVKIGPPNDAPVVDLDPSDSAVTLDHSATFSGLALPFTTDGTNLVDVDNTTFDNITVTTSTLLDESSERIEIDGATIEVNNAPVPLSIALNATSANNVFTFGQEMYHYDVTASGGDTTLVITKIAGQSLSTTEAEALLDALRYNNTAQSPIAGDRVFSVTVNDGIIDSVPAIFTATAGNTASNHAPVWSGLDGVPTIGIMPGMVASLAQGFFISPPVATDGKILVGGIGIPMTAQQEDGDFALLRYNSDGSLDNTGFSGGGFVTTAVGPTADDADYASSITLDHEKKILAAGFSGIDSSNSDSDFALVRYNPDGTLDTGFGGGDGIVTTDVGSDDMALQVVELTDHDILVVGASESQPDDSDFALLRYDSDGLLDTSFGGGDGIVTTDLESENDFASRAFELNNGKILVAGLSTRISNNPELVLVRYESDGDLDNTFGTAGIIHTEFSPSGGVEGPFGSSSIVMDATGCVLAVGVSESGIVQLVRYTSEGVLDTTFDTDGLLDTDFTASTSAPSLGTSSIAIARDGKIVLGTPVSAANDSPAYILARYNPDGTPDNDFGDKGVVTIGSDGPSSLFAYGYTQLTVDDDNNVVIQSLTGPEGVVLARYTEAGVLDTSFDGGDSPTFLVDGDPVILDTDASIFDVELHALGDYDGATLTVGRFEGLNLLTASPTAQNDFPETNADPGLIAQAPQGPTWIDHFGVTNGSGFTVDGTELKADGQIFANVINTNGSLVMSFNEGATEELVRDVLQHVTYEMDREIALEYPVTHLQWTFRDGASEDAQVSFAYSRVKIVVDTPPDLEELPTTDHLADGLMNDNEAAATIFRVTLPTDESQVVGEKVELLLGGASFTTPKTYTLTQTDIDNGHVDLTVLKADLGADGGKALSARMIDTDGQPRAVSEPLTFTLDTTRPAAPTLAESGTNKLADLMLNVSEAPSTTFHVTLPTTGSTAVAGDQVELLLGNKVLQTYTLTADDLASGHTFTVSHAELGADGRKTLSARITDVAGNAGSVSAPLSFTLDTTVPAAPTALAEQGSNKLSDGLLSASEAATATTLRVSLPTSGSLPVAGDRVELLHQGAAFATAKTVVLTDANITNQWVDVTVTGTELGADGAQALSARIVDAAGNQSAAGPARLFTLDTVAPSFTASTPTDKGTTSLSGNLVLRFSEALSATNSTPAQVALRDATGNPVAAMVSIVGDTLVIDPTDPLVDGTAYNVTWTAGALKDAAGNAVAALSDPTAFTFTADGGAPSLSEVGDHLLDGRLNASETSTTIRVTLPTSGTLAAANDSVALLLGGVALGEPKSLAANDLTNGYVDFVVASGSLGDDGLKSLTAKIGTGTASAALTFTLDTTAPGKPSQPASLSPTDLTNGMNANEAADTTFRVSLTNAQAAMGDSVELLLGNASFAAPKTLTLTQADINKSYVEFTVVTSDLGEDGQKALTARLTDAAGNVGEAGTALHFTLDTTAPAAPPAPVELNTTDLSDKLMSASEAVTTSFQVSLEGTEAKVDDYVDLLLGGKAFGAPHKLTQAEINAGVVEFTVTGSNLGDDGNKALSARLTDAAGNVGEAGAALGFTLDTKAPTFAAATLTGPNPNALNLLTLRYDEVLDPNNLPTANVFTIKVNNGNPLNAAANPPEYSITSVSGHYLTITLKDAVLANARVTVAYTDAGGDGTTVIQDLAGNDAADLSETTAYADADGDGVADAVEGGTYDGDNDGTPDSQQTTVTSLPAAADGSYITVVTDEGKQVAVALSLPPADEDLPEDLQGSQTPVWALSVDMSGVTPGASETIRFYVDADVEFNRLVKQKADGTWAELENVTVTPEGNRQRIEFSVQDNGPFDRDQTVGKISDPVVLVKAVNTAPVITSNGAGDTVTLSIDENTTAVTTVTASDPDAGDSVTFSITGGADSGQFSINANTGVLTFNSAPNFEAPTDSDGNHSYVVAITAADKNGGTDSQTITVNVADVSEAGGGGGGGGGGGVTNTAPTITSNGGGVTAAVSIAENTTAVTTVVATDPNAGDSVTYAISGGADADKFNIDASTGALSFKTAPNFENPQDVGDTAGNNTYVVAVTATDKAGASDAQTLTVTVTDVAESGLPTGAVTIGGKAIQGQTLTAANNLADPDGLGTITYQWQANGKDIAGATGSTYVLTQAEVGKTITVAASYTDGAGHAEQVVSSATAAVANINDAPTGKVSISGNLVKGQTLTASNTLADADGLGTITYQWQANGKAITGATGSTYVLTQAEVGKTITVAASYTDGFGTAERVVSSATAAVTNGNQAPTSSNGKVVTLEDTAYVFKAADFKFSDLDAGDALVKVVITALPAAGALAFSADGKTWTPVTLGQEISKVDLDAGHLRFVPAENANGADYASLGFKVSDGKSLSTAAYKLAVNVTPVRDDLTLTGTAGNDTLKGDAIDVGSYDRLIGLGGNDTLLGYAGNDILEGGAGNDILNGGTGADKMTGGNGSDRYYVDHVGDQVIETNATARTGGIDTVYSALARYTLGENVENGRILATDAANLTGNALDNLLIAGTGDNVIRGGAGIDTVSYAQGVSGKVGVTVSLAAKTAQATGGSGQDTLFGIENLTGSSYADTLTGNGGRNVLKGGAGNDTLDGGAGNDLLIGGTGKDVLTGGAGRDVFRFDTALSANNIDRITDFKVVDDTIQLENTIFTSLTATGKLTAANFRVIGSGTVLDSDDFILYEAKSGKLFYDADGSGNAEAVQFAIIGANLVLTAADFVVI